jgi:hypothetical protein
MTLTVISRIQLADRPWNFLFNRPTAQTRHQIWTCCSSKFSAFPPLLAFDIATLKIYDLDRHFQGQMWKSVHFQSKRSQNRQIRIISSSYTQTNIRRQNLFKRNFHFQGQIFKFSFFKVSQISLFILFVLTCTKSLSHFDLENAWPWLYLQRYTCWVVSFEV